MWHLHTSLHVVVSDPSRKLGVYLLFKYFAHRLLKYTYDLNSMLSENDFNIFCLHMLNHANWFCISNWNSEYLKKKQFIHVNLPAGVFFSRFWGSLPSLPSTFKIFRPWKKSSTKKILTYILRLIFLEIPHLELPCWWKMQRDTNGKGECHI